MAPKTKEQFASIRERSMRTIKETALGLFARNGFHRTPISRIAEEAGISKGLLYNYFPSKDALLEGILADVIEESERYIVELSEGVDEPLERLKLIVHGAVQMVQANPHYWKLLTSLAFQSEVLEHIEPKVKTRQAQLMGYLESLFEKMGASQPAEEAYFFGAAMDGMMLHYLSLPDTYPLHRMENFIVKRLEALPLRES